MYEEVERTIWLLNIGMKIIRKPWKMIHGAMFLYIGV